MVIPPKGGGEPAACGCGQSRHRTTRQPAKKVRPADAERMAERHHPGRLWQEPPRSTRLVRPLS
jgi:hypothetical protein